MLPEDGEQGDLATVGRRIQVRAVLSTSSGIVPVCRRRPQELHTRAVHMLVLSKARQLGSRCWRGRSLAARHLAGRLGHLHAREPAVWHSASQFDFTLDLTLAGIAQVNADSS